jgi:hypothetical protein
VTFHNDDERRLWVQAMCMTIAPDHASRQTAHCPDTADKVVEAFRKRNTQPPTPSILPDVPSVPSAEKLVEAVKPNEDEDIPITPNAVRSFFSWCQHKINQTLAGQYPDGVALQKIVEVIDGLIGPEANAPKPLERFKVINDVEPVKSEPAMAWRDARPEDAG